MADIEIKSFDSPDEVRRFEGNGQAEVVKVAGKVIGKGTFEPGWRWSENVKPIAHTDSCQVSHLGYVMSGRMKIFMDDGSEAECGPGDVHDLRLALALEGPHLVRGIEALDLHVCHKRPPCSRRRVSSPRAIGASRAADSRGCRA